MHLTLLNDTLRCKLSIYTSSDESSRNAFSHMPTVKKHIDSLATKLNLSCEYHWWYNGHYVMIKDYDFATQIVEQNEELVKWLAQ